MQQDGAWCVEIEPIEGRPDPVGSAVRSMLAARGYETDGDWRALRGFLLPASLERGAVDQLAARLLCDQVNEVARILAPGDAPERTAVLIRRHPGVADPEAASVRRALPLLGLPDLEVATYRGFTYLGGALLEKERLLRVAGRVLGNPTIESAHDGSQPLLPLSPPPSRPTPRVEVPLSDLDDRDLLAVSKNGGLALSLEEMTAIRDHYLAEGRAPTDVELETLAQTWSEHCKHKTLTGPVVLSHTTAKGETEERRFDNLLKETVFAATERLSPDWCWSVFKDNAGVVELTPETGIAVKVETHNHPSALEPYGGAGTGIGGVIRDILGTGLGARPFAATDVFCVGPTDLDRSDLPDGCMHPSRVLEGVVSGVRDYGNRMGIPTVAGTVLCHPGYVGNPLVFAGCVGEIPRDCVDKRVDPGDIIVAIGGRTGRDGIHGATFSSEALTSESDEVSGTAVQIGDPITEKKVLDVLLQARDRRLYRAVTDCGAGGFSSAVGEMGEECGAEVELSLAPLKYPGLTYSEIWISEAQERMVFAVPPEKLTEMLALCGSEEVEAVALGSFTDTGRLVLTWHGETVGDMPMDFLHGGVPQPPRAAVVVDPPYPRTPWPNDADYSDLLLRTLADSTVASKESIVRQYDHEVQGGTVIKPYQGSTGHSPGDGTVLKPDPNRPEGVAIGCGIAPRIALLDSYAGALCAIDEAVRNVVAAGGSPHRVALLDNFCWGDCRKPDRLGSLTRAAEACFDAALAYGAPFISGKDSLNNEFLDADGEQHPIPPTLLATAVAPLADSSAAVGAHLVAPDSLLLLLGVTRGDGGGSVAAELLALPDSLPPRPDLAASPALYDALHRAIHGRLLRACHDLAEGGLAVAAAELCFGGQLGAVLDIEELPVEGELPSAARLFSETPGRFLLEVAPSELPAITDLFAGLPWAAVGQTTDRASLSFRRADETLIDFDTASLLHAYREEAPW